MKRLLLSVLIIELLTIAGCRLCQEGPPGPSAPKSYGAGATPGIGPGVAQTVTGDAAANVPVFSGTFGQQRTAIVQLSGVTGSAGLIHFQGSNDGTNWNDINCVNLGGVATAATNIAATTIANGLWLCNVDGFLQFQAQGVLVDSGTAVINVSPNANPISFAIIDASTAAPIRQTY